MRGIVRSPVVRFVTLEGNELTVAGDVLVWVNGEACEASSVDDPHAMVRLAADTRHGKGGEILMLARSAPRAGLAGGERPPVHYYDIRGALVMPAPTPRPTTVPTLEESQRTQPARKSARNRGTVILNSFDTVAVIRWPDGTKREVIRLVMESLPAGATIAANNDSVRFESKDAAEILAALRAALTDVGFAVMRG